MCDYFIIIRQNEMKFGMNNRLSDVNTQFKVLFQYSLLSYFYDAKSQNY